MERRWRCEPLVVVVSDGAFAVDRRHQKEQQHRAGMLDDEQAAAAGAIIKGHRGTEPGDQPGAAGVAT